jgi:DNA-binding CsgD family transcriptional regulator
VRVKLGRAYITPRERQILELYASGYSTAATAKRLGIQHSTLSGQLSKARDRVRVKTIHQLVAIYAATYPIRERGRSSNRDDSASTVSVTSMRVDEQKARFSPLGEVSK